MMATRAMPDSPDCTEDEASAFRIVGNFLDSNDLDYIEHESDGLFVLAIRTASALFHTTIKVASYDDSIEVSVFVAYPVKINSDRRAAVAEAIQHGSFSLVRSVPEIDMNDGEVRVKSTVTVIEGRLTDKLIALALFGSVNIASTFLEPLLSVGFGRTPPSAVREMLMAQTTSGQSLQ